MGRLSAAALGGLLVASSALGGLLPLGGTQRPQPQAMRLQAPLPRNTSKSPKTWCNR